MAVALVVALFALSADAYKSVRVKRPETEDEREAHAEFHARRPESHETDENMKHAHHGETFHQSKSYHYRYGPRTAGHDKREISHRTPKRVDADGHVIPGFVQHNPDHDKSRRPIAG